MLSYETREPHQAALEAHRRYIDIQTVLFGGEGIAWHPAGCLEVREAYDAGKDVEFYSSPAQFPSRLDVTPGYFVALFPHDAHMPQLELSGLPSWVKKVVVKVNTSLYTGKVSGRVNE